jgi:hypothetical protein
MTPQAMSQPRRRRYGWWIAGGVAAAAVFALAYTAVVYLAEPAKFAYGFVSANPSSPDCDTTVVRDATAGALWYRLVEMRCDTETLHLLYAARGTGPGWFVPPAFLSAGSPVPVSVRQTGEDAFEIVLEQPLADGTASLPLVLHRYGIFKNGQFFDHGRQESSSPDGE